MKLVKPKVWIGGRKQSSDDITGLVMFKQWFKVRKHIINELETILWTDLNMHVKQQVDTQHATG